MAVGGLAFTLGFETGVHGAGSHLLWHINRFRFLAIEILLVCPLISILKMFSK